MQRFEQAATSAFGAVSPEFELPAEERYMANVYGRVLPHSGTLREGMARSLALMGTQADRARNAEGSSYVPARVVSTALEGAKGWQTWATLSGSLTELAEAEPEALLDAVERDLAADPSPFEDLFAQEGDGLFGGTPPHWSAVGTRAIGVVTRPLCESREVSCAPSRDRPRRAGCQ